MYLEERYSKMTDSEVLERYKDFDSCFYVAQIIILKELEKRKLISEEKIKIHYQEINDKKEKEKSESIAKEKKSPKKSSFKTLFLIFIIGGVIKVLLPLAISNMGNSAYLEKKYEKAEKLYRISEMINDGYPANLRMLGTVLVLEQKYKEALRPLLKAKRIDEERQSPNDWTLRYLSLAYLNLKNYEEFEKIFPDAIKYTSNNESKASYYSNISRYYFKIYDNKKGLAYINEAIKINSEDADNYHLRGAIYIELDEYDKAVEDFLIQLKKQKEMNNDVYYRLFICYRNKENLEKSLEYLNLYISNYDKDLGNNELPLYYFYAIKSELLKTMGDLNGSKEYADKVININKNEISNQELYGKAIEIIKFGVKKEK